MEKSKPSLAVAALMISAAALAQTAAPPSTSGSAAATPRATYALGPDDVISIRVADAEEVSDKGLRIPPSGSVNLALVGRIQVSGLTAEELEKELADKLKPYIRTPDVAVNIVELRSQPVSVIGAVNASGVHQLQGRKTLVEVLSLAGGVRAEAGYDVKITRLKEWGPIPLPTAAMDPTGQFSVAEVNLKDIMEAKKPAENILIMPNDVISVPKAEMVYVIGDVNRAGGFILGEKPHMSVLQALSLGGGLQRSASMSKAKILRASAEDSRRTEIKVNLKNILDGKDQDVPMEPEDILFVPNSRAKTAAGKGLETILQIVTGVAIYKAY